MISRRLHDQELIDPKRTLTIRDGSLRNRLSFWNEPPVMQRATCRLCPADCSPQGR